MPTYKAGECNGRAAAGFEAARKPREGDVTLDQANDQEEAKPTEDPSYDEV
jgi:hypothetical protein